MAEAFTVMAVATFIKDAMEVWDKIENSFSRVSQNRRSAQRLVREIRNDLILLKDLYEDHHTTLDKSPRTGRAMRTLIENMDQVQQACSLLLPPVSEKRFEKYSLKYYAWKNGGKIEEELLDLKSHVSECRQRFNTLAIARVEIGGIEHRHITVSRIDGLQNMLSDISISTNHLCAFHPGQSRISSSIVNNIPDQYLKIILSTMAKTLHKEAFVPFFLYFNFLSCPTIQGSNDDLSPHDKESLHRDTVTFALDTHRRIESSFIEPKTELDIFILTRMVRYLGMSQEADSIDWRGSLPRNVIDQYRPQMRKMAYADGESIVLSSNSEVIRHLDMLDHIVDLFFRFREHHYDAVEKSGDIFIEISWTYHGIWQFYWLHDALLPEVETIQAEIERLQIHARQIHMFDQNLPLLDI